MSDPTVTYSAADGAVWGFCERCHAPRRTKTTTQADGSAYIELECSAETAHNQDP